MLSSQVMMRPVTIARLTMLVVSMVIIVVQCIGFSQILLRVLEHNKLSAYVQKAGAALKASSNMRGCHHCSMIAYHATPCTSYVTGSL